jgi:hypothetical protein
VSGALVDVPAGYRAGDWEIETGERATLRSDANARRWPSTAKATVLAAALGVLGTMGAVVLGAPA